MELKKVINAFLIYSLIINPYPFGIFFLQKI